MAIFFIAQINEIIAIEVKKSKCPFAEGKRVLPQRLGSTEGSLYFFRDSVFV